MIEHVTVLKSGDVVRLRLNRADTKNTSTRAMYQTLADAIKHADGDPAIRIISISASGDAFASGNDLKDFTEKSAPTADSLAILLLNVIARVRKPLIAGASGLLAAGISVAELLHCDVVYAAEEATFQLPFVNIRQVPDAPSGQLLSQVIFFLADEFDARAAQSIGLVNAVYPRRGLDAALDELAKTLANRPPAPHRATKKLLTEGLLGADVSCRLTEQIQLKGQLASAAAKQTMAAFLAEPPPDFSRVS